MNVELKKIYKNKKRILENMLQLYLHDISFYFPIDFDDNKGIYIYDSLNKYFDESENEAYFINIDSKISGFILFDKNEKNLCIQEMFVLNNYKNKGIGKEAVFLLLNKYVGNWTIRSLPLSELAEKFWNRTIKNYTNNNYNKEIVGKYNRAVFTFSNLEKNLTNKDKNDSV